MNQNIIFAVEQKRILRLQYSDFNRLVEPHAYGLDDKGIPKLRCYQIEGGSSSSARAGWKLLNVDDIAALQVVDQVFPAPRPDYNINDPIFVQIFARILVPGHADWRG